MLSPCVWVALRRRTDDPLPAPGWADWLRGTYHFSHAQITVPVPCTPALGRATCQLCDQTAATRAPPGRQHTLTYSADARRHVHHRVDVAYNGRQWELWELPLPLPFSGDDEEAQRATGHVEDTLRALREWLRQQESLRFHAEALEHNARWAPWCACCPLACVAHWALGVRHGRQPQTATAWFCTELCVAALQRLGFLSREVACATSPDRLAARIAAIPGAQRVPLASLPIPPRRTSSPPASAPAAPPPAPVAAARPTRPRF